MKTTALFSTILGVLLFSSCEQDDSITPSATSNEPKTELIAVDDPTGILENLTIQGAESQQGGAPGSSSASEIPVITSPADIQLLPNGASFNFKFEFSDLLSPGRASEVYVWVPGSEFHLKINMDESNTLENAFSTTVTLPDNIEEGRFEIAYSVGDSEGNTSITSTFEVITTFVGNGDLLLNLTWEASIDLDLQLIEPDGTYLDFTNRSSDNGGKFISDETYGVHPESVVYANEPENGTYMVNVSFPDNGTPPLINSVTYLLTLYIDGTPVTYSGWIDHGQTLHVVEFTKTDKDMYSFTDR